MWPSITHSSRWIVGKLRHGPIKQTRPGRPSTDRSRGTAAHHCAREATNGAQTKSVEGAQQREEEGLGWRPLGT
jgi:hypothetical protein